MPPRVADIPDIMRTRAWRDYALLDSGDGRKLERYGRFTVVRPEPQCFWAPSKPKLWERPDAVFDPDGDEDEGRWRFSKPVPESWTLGWDTVKFHGRFTAFRHLAFFPEQAANWAWLKDRVEQLERPRVLNLFGYTGVASLVCAAAGAQVTHVDASKKSVAYARENAALSGLESAPIRWITEDARKYVTREVKRGSQYEGIILDPPKYGRGPTGEVWRLFEDLPELARQCAALLSDRASFLLLNAYAARVSGPALAGLLSDACAERGGRIDWGELVLSEDGPNGREIGLSFFARWSAE
ncbi:class I SAM-dependent methyltransferase [Caulobacter sp. 17J65-9]|uniref:class I SAM-dependent methyltransferase n=1 Tax=Caulobacter sp. 17J65-9 TaxID=2709382 RepID=UPI0013CD964D|nr:class I SAM-dependent methyltransferase [Caulobacter sp. 17J65-9]NEX94486.1 class I SAM-dependent rRNA methyltransferase [Caulobacter sp. 17J65-9]